MARLAALAVPLGAVTGFAAAGLVVVLHGAQDLAAGAGISPHDGAGRWILPPAMAAVGLLMAVAWYLARRFLPGAPTSSAAAAGAHAPPIPTTADAVLQVVNVGAGASIGREGAPRLMGAMVGGVLAARLRLGESGRAILLASGAGAGLAAIYDVPWAGALFALEATLGLRVSVGSPRAAARNILVAVVAAWSATLCARVVVPNRPTYALVSSAASWRLLLFCLVLGPLLGLVGIVFRLLFDAASRRAPRHGRLLLEMPICYLLLGLIAVGFPAVLGNGHALVNEELAGDIARGALIPLGIAKIAATVLTVRAGAVGGRLTPSYSTGIALGAGAAVAANSALGAGLPVLTAAAAAAGALLATATRAPLTAAALAIGLTGLALPPAGCMVVAVGGAWAVGRLWDRRASAARAGGDVPVLKRWHSER